MKDSLSSANRAANRGPLPGGAIASRRHRLAWLSVIEWLGVALLAALTTAVLALFHFQGNTTDTGNWGHSALAWLVRRWKDSGLSIGGGDYSHGGLVPVISAGLLWVKRDEIAAVAKRVWWPGVVLVAGCLLLHYVGAMMQQTRLSLFALIGLAWSVPVFLWGIRLGWLLLFPCAFLFFAVPFDFLDSVSFRLQGIMTGASRFLLHGLGIEVRQIGHMLFPPMGNAYAFNVDVPCSGIRSLQALTALTAIYAHLTQPTLLRKWMLFLSAFPLAVVGNMVRVVAIVVVAEGISPDLASGAFHDLSPFIVFAVAITLMVLFGNLLNRFGGEQRAVGATTGDGAREWGTVAERTEKKREGLAPFPVSTEMTSQPPPATQEDSWRDDGWGKPQ